MTSGWPSKDAFDPHVHTSACHCGEPPTLAPLPDGHQFTRTCPRCTQTLAKRTAEDLFACNRCGWREWREAEPRRRWT